MMAHLGYSVADAVQDTAGPFSAMKPLGKEGFKQVISSFGISLIGGFLGLQLISEVADRATREMFKRLKGEVEQQKEDTSIVNHAFLARSFLKEGFIDQAQEEIGKSLKIRSTRFGEFVSALILKQRADYAGAVGAIDRALRLPPDGYVRNDATLNWNKACYLARLDVDANLKDILACLDQSLKLRPEYRNDLTTDDDLIESGALDNPLFKEHFQPLK